MPSVFVLFTKIYESPPAHLPRSPLDPPHPDKDTEERRRDAELAGEIAQRKKSTAERGIKLTVVLLASRRMLGMQYIACDATIAEMTGQTILRWIQGCRSSAGKAVWTLALRCSS